MHVINMVSAESYSQVDLNYLEEEITRALAEDKDSEDWLKRLEPDFGKTSQSHLFVQTDSFNGFLYEDRAVLHILNADVQDPVYKILDQFYDIENQI